MTLNYVLDVNRKKQTHTFIGKCKYKSMHLVSFELVFMLSNSKIMARFDVEVNMLLILGECEKNYRRAAQLFFERYGIQKSHMAFLRLENRLRVHGQLSAIKRQKAKKVVNYDNSVNILAAVELNPRVSQRELVNTSGVKRSSIQRILKGHKFHPYHFILTQELLEADYERRLIFCEWMRNAIGNNSFLQNILFSDEAQFTNTGHLNRHNMHYWSHENPHWMRTVPFQHRWSLTVWCGIIGDFVIGPYFFDGTINTESYCNLLRNHLPLLLEELPLNIRRDIWFQQDGAPPHFSRATRTLLNEIFGDRWIGRGGPIQWPPRSPDLTPLDYFLWGYIKEKVTSEPLTTKEDLKRRICEACASVTSEMLELGKVL